MTYLAFKSQVYKIKPDFVGATSRSVTSAAKGAWKVAVKNTPYDTRTAQNGWKLSTSRRFSYIPVKRRQSYPTVPKFKFLASKHNKFYLYNNVPYISYLEYGSRTNVASYMLKKAIRFFEVDFKRRMNIEVDK